MFGWRKRSEGFEWKEYVRTTILVRRADRQRRIEEARLAALGRAKEARERSIEAGKRQLHALIMRTIEGVQSGSLALTRAAWSGLATAALAIFNLFRAVLSLLYALPKPPMNVPSPLAKSAGLAFLYAGDIPRRWRLVKPYLVPAAAGLVAILGFGHLFAPEEAQTRVAKTSTLVTASIATADKDDQTDLVKGRASAVSGDVLRLGNRFFRLAGVEAPEPGQICAKANGRTWDCGASAQSALQRLIRGRRIACEPAGPAGEGLSRASCMAGDLDIARELVRGGFAFANGGSHAYSSEEDLARSEGQGLWQGTPERPEEWRTKLWNEAKKEAPDGCPIKGFVKSGGRIYAMPWSSGYGRRELRTVKGERWFCSEDEARAAGFRPSTGL